MAATGRRAAAQKNSARAQKSSAKAKRAAGVLTVPRILHKKASRLITINAPGVTSFKKRRAAASTGRIHGLTVVNGPGSRRSTAGSKPSGHGVNAPKGQW